MAQPFKNKGIKIADRVNNYDAFVEKFNAAAHHTTDDCLTPPVVYSTLIDYLRERGFIKEGQEIVRPFFPGGDFENHFYPPGSIVVDNPPFSILSTRIVPFFVERRQPFVLFTQGQTCMKHSGGYGKEITILNTATCIRFHNGTSIRISFLAYGIEALKPYAIVNTPTLHARLEAIHRQGEKTKRLTRYSFPPCLSNIARLMKYANCPLAIRKEELQRVYNVECMRKLGKQIFSMGFFLSDDAVKRLEQLDKKQQTMDEENYHRVVVRLSDEEQALVDELNHRVVVRLSDEEQALVDELNHRAATAEPLPPLPPL